VGFNFFTFLSKIHHCGGVQKKNLGKKIGTFKAGGGKKSTPWPEYIPLLSHQVS